jgi:hypothetical protein
MELEVGVDQTGRIGIATEAQRRWRSALRSEWLYVWIAIAAAGAVLFSGLTSYPSQVTPDEAYPSLRAAELIENGFKGTDEIFPAFLPGKTPTAIGTSAYLQVLPQLLRPNTLLWVRFVNAFLAFLAALILAAWLRYGFQLKFYWVLLPLLCGIPSWFTFSRTALDISLASSLLAMTLACYGFYRLDRRRFIFAGIILGMGAFYAAPAARLAVSSAALLLVLVDWRYHWQERRILAQAAILTGVLAIPLIYFLTRHPNGFSQELAAAESFLAAEIRPGLKAGQFVLAALNTLNPAAWMLSDPNLPAVYQTGPHPPLPVLIAPFILWGGWSALQRSVQPQMRIFWIGLAATAVGAAPYGGHLPESLLSVPLLAILAVFGLHAGVDWLKTRWKRMPEWLPAPVLITAMVLGSAGLLVEVLINSGQWKRDYGREGLQYGAPQIFKAATHYLVSQPQREIILWPDWTSDAEALRRFFVPDPEARISIGSVEQYFYRRTPDLEQKTFVLSADDYHLVRSSGKFEVKTLETIPLPDGQTGFALVELTYSPQFDQILAQEEQQRRILVSEPLPLLDSIAVVRHSAFDIGTAANLFDGSPDSLVRTLAANPLVVVIDFPKPVDLSGVQLQLGAEWVTLSAAVTLADGTISTTTREAPTTDGFKTSTFDFGRRVSITSLRLEVLDKTAGEPAHVHLWEIHLLE